MYIVNLTAVLNRGIDTTMYLICPRCLVSPVNLRTGSRGSGRLALLNFT